MQRLPTSLRLVRTGTIGQNQTSHRTAQGAIDHSPMILRISTFLFLLFVSAALFAEVRYPTLEDSRRAIRCSYLFGIAAREAYSDQVKNANRTARGLMLRLGSLSAGTQLTLSWVDELEKEMPLSDEQLMAMNDDCKKLLTEQRELIGLLRENRL